MLTLIKHFKEITTLNQALYSPGWAASWCYCFTPFYFIRWIQIEIQVLFHVVTMNQVQDGVAKVPDDCSVGEKEKQFITKKVSKRPYARALVQSQEIVTNCASILASDTSACTNDKIKKVITLSTIHLKNMCMLFCLNFKPFWPGHPSYLHLH
jgi:hypothetical protein